MEVEAGGSKATRRNFVPGRRAVWQSSYASMVLATHVQKLVQGTSQRRARSRQSYWRASLSLPPLAPSYSSLLYSPSLPPLSPRLVRRNTTQASASAPTHLSKREHCPAQPALFSPLRLLHDPVACPYFVKRVTKLCLSLSRGPGAQFSCFCLERSSNTQQISQHLLFTARSCETAPRPPFLAFAPLIILPAPHPRSLSHHFSSRPIHSHLAQNVHALCPSMGQAHQAHRIGSDTYCRSSASRPAEGRPRRHPFLALPGPRPASLRLAEPRQQRRPKPAAVIFARHAHSGIPVLRWRGLLPLRWRRRPERQQRSFAFPVPLQP